jgi:hypothetical protein
MQVVTADIYKAKELVAATPPNISFLKRQAHRNHRRAWRQYLNELTQGAPQDDAREIELEAPRLTAWDIA